MKQEFKVGDKVEKVKDTTEISRYSGTEHKINVGTKGIIKSTFRDDYVVLFKSGFEGLLYVTPSQIKRYGFTQTKVE